MTIADLRGGKLTLRERGYALKELWCERLRTAKDKKIFREWVEEERLGKVKECEILVHFARKEWTYPVWALLDEGYTLAGAESLCRLATHRARDTGRPPRELLDELLDEMKDEEKWRVCRAGGGKWCYKRVKNVPVHKAVKKTTVEGKASYSAKNSRQLWGAVRELVVEFAKEQLPSSVDDSSREELVRDFELGMRVAFEDLMRNVEKYKREARSSPPVISREKLLFACQCLGIPMQWRGGPIDMRKARDRYRKLAIRFHPDKVGDAEDTLKQYRAVNEAWGIIKSYMEAKDGK